MEKLIVRGGHTLEGEVTISGAKNAAVAIIPACILVSGVCRLENVPNIRDTKLFFRILTELGAKVEYVDEHTVDIDCTNINSWSPSMEYTKEMRGSSYLMGALLGRFKRCSVPSPGGCDFGTRPIDQHLKFFRALGAEVNIEYDVVEGYADKLKGANVYFDVVTVGATVNAILSAVLAEGTTIIDNAAKEPHIVDLANFLNAMGANVRGAGTSTIKIRGTDKLHGGTYAIIPDQIEAGTFMIAAAATRGDVVLKNVIPRHLEVISAKLEEIGAVVEETGDSVHIYVPEGRRFRNVDFVAMPYPGFPTDMQPQMVTFLTTVSGVSNAREGVWDDRFRYTSELKRMGANIRVEGPLAIIQGVPALRGTSVKATDLRAGAAMIIAGMMANGTTEISDIYHIDRGYENFEDKFIHLGADIHRVTVMGDYF